jgi:hypothetical protein
MDPILKSITPTFGDKDKPNLMKIGFKFGDGRAQMPVLFTISILWEKTNSDMPPAQPTVDNPLFQFAGM